VDKLMIIVAPGAPPSELAKHPELPRTPQQLADAVIEAQAAGACIAHLHVVDEAGNATFDLKCFNKTLDLIRRKCDILIEGSTGGVAELTVEQRCVALDADIEMASLNPGSCNHAWGKIPDAHIVRGLSGPLPPSLAGVYINSPSDIDFWVNRMKDRGIRPTPAIFEVGFIENTVKYIRDGAIPAPVLFNLVMGLPGAMPCTANNLLFEVNSLPPGSLWQATGYQHFSLQAGAWAAMLGGAARVGFEDYVYYEPHKLARSNAQFVERIARIAQEIGRPIATTDDARAMLQIKKR
jgi:3-keto-5-aminohexanoate cleavage enzyme